jgi:membrane protein DedA with SNARE-associated domain
MPFWRFTTLTVIGCIPWVFMLGLIGDITKRHWTNWKSALGYVDYVVVALVVIGIAWLVIRRRRARNGSQAAADAPL